MAGSRHSTASSRAQSQPNSSSGTSRCGAEWSTKEWTYGGEDEKLHIEGEGEETRDANDSGSVSTSTRHGRGPSKTENLEPPSGEKWKIRCNNRGKPFGIEGKKLRRRKRIQDLREARASSQIDCSMEHILTEVIGDSKGKAVHGLRKHHKRKAVATSAGRYSQEHINCILSQNQMLQEEFARRGKRQQIILEELRSIRAGYARMFELVAGLCSSYPDPQLDQPPNEASGGSRSGGSG